YFMKKIPAQSEEKIEEAARVPRMILAQPRRVRNSLIAGLFLAGGLLLYFSAPPFLRRPQALAARRGNSALFFVSIGPPAMSSFNGSRRSSLSSPKRSRHSRGPGVLPRRRWL